MSVWINLLFPFYDREYLMWSLVCKSWHKLLKSKVKPMTRISAITTTELLELSNININKKTLLSLLKSGHYEVLRHVYEEYEISHEYTFMRNILISSTKTKNIDFYNWAIDIGGIFSQKVYLNLLELGMYEEFNEIPQILYSRIYNSIINYFIELDNAEVVEFLCSKFKASNRNLAYAISHCSKNVFSYLIKNTTAHPITVVNNIIKKDFAELLPIAAKHIPIYTSQNNIYLASLKTIVTYNELTYEKIDLNHLLYMTEDRETYFWALKMGAKQSNKLSDFTILQNKIDRFEVLPPKFYTDLLRNYAHKVLAYALEYQYYEFENVDRYEYECWKSYKKKFNLNFNK
jgi:hypothetical protein